MSDHQCRYAMSNYFNIQYVFFNGPALAFSLLKTIAFNNSNAFSSSNRGRRSPISVLTTKIGSALKSLIAALERRADALESYGEQQMSMTKKSTQGLYTAITTPMKADGSLNLPLISTQVEKQLRAGISGIVAVGGTGEASALAVSERVDVVRATVEAVAGKVPVIAGVTSSGLPDTLALGHAFLDAGVDGLMVITPYGTAPSQGGIRDYFKAVADGLGQAVMLYDIPYLTHVTTDPQTVLDIANDGSIFAMKASNPDQSAFTRLVQLVGDKISIMSGDEHLFAVQIALGAVGGVLASTNILPRIWVQIMETAQAGDLVLAQQQIARIHDFLVTVYAEPNPGPMKAAQALAGFDVGPVRIPNRAPEQMLLSKMREHLTELLTYEDALAGEARG